MPKYRIVLEIEGEFTLPVAHATAIEAELTALDYLMALDDDTGEYYPGVSIISVVEIK